MAYDLSYIWEVLKSIASTIIDWFNSLWSAIQQIANVGQGIFFGLTSFGSFIWDSLVKFSAILGSWFGQLGNLIKLGIENLAKTFGEWFYNAFSWIWGGLTWIGSQIYSFGNWIYNAIIGAINWVVNAIVNIWNSIVEWFNNLLSTLQSWWTGIRDTVNAWFTNLMINFRRKLFQTVWASTSITIAWKSGEKIYRARRLRDVLLGVGGILASPIVGYMVASIADSLVPTPSTTNVQLIPPIDFFQYKQGTIAVPAPSPLPTPQPPQPPLPPGVFPGVISLVASIEASYEANWFPGRDLSASIETTVESNSFSGQDLSTSVSTSVEVTVA